MNGCSDLRQHARSLQNRCRSQLMRHLEGNTRPSYYETNKKVQRHFEHFPRSCRKCRKNCLHRTITVKLGFCCTPKGPSHLQWHCSRTPETDYLCFSTAALYGAARPFEAVFQGLGQLKGVVYDMKPQPGSSDNVKAAR